MREVSGRFLSALRGGQRDVRVRATLTTTDGTARNLRVSDGQVRVDGQQMVRRVLTMGVPSSAWLREAVLAPGSRIFVEHGLRFPDRQVEYVPVGVFVPTFRDLDLDPDGTIQLEGDDLMRLVERARFTRPIVTNGSAVSEALRLCAEATGALQINEASAQARSVLTRRAVWERDRMEAVTALADAAGVEVFFDGAGAVVARDVPVADRTGAVWSIDAGPAGVLTGGSESEGTQDVYNTVVVTSAALGEPQPTPPVTVMDTNPASPTYVGPPGDRTLVPYFVTSELVRTPEQMRRVGLVRLRQVSRRSAQARVSCIPNPALEAGDVVVVAGTDGVSSSHQVEAFTVPLTPEGLMSVTMRSSRADDPEGEQQ